MSETTTPAVTSSEVAFTPHQRRSAFQIVDTIGDRASRKINGEGRPDSDLENAILTDVLAGKINLRPRNQVGQLLRKHLINSGTPHSVPLHVFLRPPGKTAREHDRYNKAQSLRSQQLELLEEARQDAQGKLEFVSTPESASQVIDAFRAQAEAIAASNSNAGLRRLKREEPPAETEASAPAKKKPVVAKKKAATPAPGKAEDVL